MLQLGNNFLTFEHLGQFVPFLSMQVFINNQSQVPGLLWENYIVASKTGSTIGLLLGRVVYNSKGAAVGKIIDNVVYDLEGNTLAILKKQHSYSGPQLDESRLKKQGWEILSKIKSYEKAYWVEKSEKWSDEPFEKILLGENVHAYA